MAKLSFLGEVVCAALLSSFILLQETSSSSLGPFSSTVTEETITGSSCGGITCPPGKSCQPNSEGDSECLCNTVCTQQYDPVCGSDGKTYGNGCMLSVEACLTGNITEAHRGECETGTDVCSNFICPLDKRCVLNTTENRPECVCNEGCYFIYAPVCGNDGQTYVNDCLLRVEACKTNTNITIEHKGNCNDSHTCDYTTCPPGKSCQLNSEGQPECICDIFCTKHYDPVCGSDGKTYGNECMLRLEACRIDTNITEQHKGRCNDSCTGFECPYYGRCVVDSDNRPTCVCRLGCPKIYSPVCGSDNKTYSNECLLQAEACQTNTSITVAHKGECVDGGCENVLCSPGKYCVLNNESRPECVCTKGCFEIYRPVCGSDNKTYSNECELWRDACLTNSNTTVLHLGKCEDGGCDQITCPPGKSCDLNSTGQPECICDTMCTMELAPVCGSDGQTYGNRCALRLAACQTNSNITVVHDGECEKVSGGTVTASSTRSIRPDHRTKKPKCPKYKKEC